MIASVILTMLLILIVPGAGQTSNPVGRLVEALFWIPQLACGAMVGWFLRRHFAIFNSGYALLIPLAFLLWNILTEGLRMRAYTPLKDIYFSANSGDTEGLYKLFFTAPVYTAVAYCLGAFAARQTSLNPN
jgi:hypothetical protein